VFVPGKSPVRVQPKINDIFLESCTLFIWTVRHVSLLVVNVMWIDLDSLAFILHSLNQFWISSRSVCSLCEAMAGSLSMATTAVSSAKVAAVDCGGVGYCKNLVIALALPSIWVEDKQPKLLRDRLSLPPTH
jgi:hypothetical protein